MCIPSVVGMTNFLGAPLLAISATSACSGEILVPALRTAFTKSSASMGFNK